MIHAQMTKSFIVVSPRAILTAGSWSVNDIDTLGFRYCRVLGTLGATSDAFTAWKMQESDVSGSGFADVTGLVASGSTGDGRLPQATDDDTLFGFDIDLRGRKRYLRLVATIGATGTGAFLGVVATLSRAEEAPNTTAERGLAGYLHLPA